MARIDTVSEREAGPFGHLAYGLSRRRFGEVVEPLMGMLHHPRLLLGSRMLELAFEKSDLVDEHLKSLAMLKAAIMVGCEFCIDTGSALSRAESVTEEQFRELADYEYERSEVFSPLEKLVLRYAVAMTRTPAVVPDELFDALREHFSEAQLVELTAAIVLKNHRARPYHALGIEAQGFSEGSFRLVPETLAAVTTNGGDQL